MKRRATLKRAKSDAVRAERRRLQVLVGADRFLLVLCAHFGAQRPVVDFLALAGVVLKRLPCFAVVRAFHDRQRVRFQLGAKLKALKRKNL